MLAPPNDSMERKSSPGSARLGLRFASPHGDAVAPSAHRTWGVPLISRAIGQRVQLVTIQDNDDDSYTRLGLTRSTGKGLPK
jgi:hypothetical protein